MKEQSVGASVFVKVSEYKEIVDVLDMTKAKISEIRQTLANVNELRNQEDSEISMWGNTIDEIEKKIEDIDRMMFEPE